MVARKFGQETQLAQVHAQDWHLAPGAQPRCVDERAVPAQHHQEVSLGCNVAAGRGWDARDSGLGLDQRVDPALREPRNHLPRQRRGGLVLQAGDDADDGHGARVSGLAGGGSS